MTDYFDLHLSREEQLSLSALGMAHLGDGVYELMVRSWLILQGFGKKGNLHRETVARVRASYQAKALARIEPLLTAEEVGQLIAELDQLPEEQAESHSMRAIKDLYHQVLTSYDCRRLAGLIKGVCRRRSWAVHHGRKISQMDERYLKRAEDALYGELGAVLGLPREEVPAYIRKTWPKWPLF